MIRPLTCPICSNTLPINASSTSPDFPFCSQRCREIDIYRWSEGKYAIIEPLDPSQQGHPADDGDAD